jgi:hypothetical protein
LTDHVGCRLPTKSGGRTTLTNRGAPINATESVMKTFEAGHNSMQAGFKATMDQFDD